MGPRTCLTLLAFTALVPVSSRACLQNTVARGEFIANCQGKAAANRVGNAGVADPLLNEVDDNGQGYDCAKIYEGRIASCERIEKKRLADENALSATADVSAGTGAEGSAKVQALSAKATASQTSTTAPKPKTRASTDYSAATDENRRGAQQTSEAVDEVGRADSEIRKMANHSADVAVKRAGQNVKQSRTGSASSRAAAKQDQALAQEGKAALREGKGFPKDLAAKASDEMVRQHLKVVSRATQSEPVLAKEENRLLGQLSELLKLASLAQGRGDAMASEGSAPRSLSSVGSAEGSRISKEESAPGRASAAASLSGAKHADGTHEAGEGDDEPAITSAQTSAAVGSNEAALAKRRSLRSSLKERLRKLLDADHAEATAGVAQFAPELSSELGSPAHDAEVSPRDRAIKQFLSDSLREAEEPFAMSAAESEASAFLQSAEAELGTLRGGILTAETASLFARVSGAYRSRRESFLVVP